MEIEDGYKSEVDAVNSVVGRYIRTQQCQYTNDLNVICICFIFERYACFHDDKIVNVRNITNSNKKRVTVFTPISWETKLIKPDRLVSFEADKVYYYLKKNMDGYAWEPCNVIQLILYVTAEVCSTFTDLILGGTQ